MIRRKPYIFGANQNRNRLNLSVAKYITHWFQRKLTAPIRPMVKRLNKPFGGPDRFPALVDSSNMQCNLDCAMQTQLWINVGLIQVADLGI